MLNRSCALLGSVALSLVLAAPLSAQFNPTINVNCAHVSLAAVAAHAIPNLTINVKGACAGPVAITADGVQVNAIGTASINGAGKDAVTVTGAHNVVLSGLTITGGGSGVVAQGGAQVTLANDTVSGNKISGIVALGNSSITVSGGSDQGNFVHGLDIEATSALIVAGSYTVAGNGVFGINVNNGSSITLTGASLSVTANTLGIQLGTNASGFLDGQSSLNASGNFSDGITVVSGSHVVDFGGIIQASNNAIHGISLNSKAGLDLDAGSQVTASSNGQDGVHLEQRSELTIFNNPNFSGNPGTTTVTVKSNGGVGINLLTGSQLLDDNYAAVQSTGNHNGIVADDGSSISFGQTVPVSGVTSNISDILLTFGSRLTYAGNDTIGAVHCDATALLRGPGAFTCPN